MRGRSWAVMRVYCESVSLCCCPSPPHTCRSRGCPQTPAARAPRPPPRRLVPQRSVPTLGAHAQLQQRLREEAVWQWMGRGHAHRPWSPSAPRRPTEPQKKQPLHLPSQLTPCLRMGPAGARQGGRHTLYTHCGRAGEGAMLACDRTRSRKACCLSATRLCTSVLRSSSESRSACNRDGLVRQNASHQTPSPVFKCARTRMHTHLQGCSALNERR